MHLETAQLVAATTCVSPLRFFLVDYWRGRECGSQGSSLEALDLFEQILYRVPGSGSQRHRLVASITVLFYDQLYFFVC